ncbi:AraC family transcriptional regulator [Paradesertivirga mongoliensis]|uniref:AraC family transcriptional regulator n=1 Tax=Paradesertivirga mongoliensis TaxID=2100740 RepID=A0ABW4ZJV8_9SPHI|nr:AraC family transcriptional regulator [Pedobacter mongoliensis]
MKPQLLKVPTGPTRSFSVRQDLVPYVNNKWHYHPEVELIYFKKGTGTQFVGDNIKRFRPGDVILIGTQLPHYWRFDDVYFQKDTKATADVRVAHFCENFWGDKFLSLPENQHIRSVLEKGKRGIQITGKTKKDVSEILNKLLYTDGSQRIMLLMEALEVIGNCNQIVQLSSMGFKNNFEEPEKSRINAIYEYSMNNFRRKIQLEEIADIARISPNSFCRYFKSRTRKTYTQFIIELKVGHACKLLIDNELSIKQICYESGFNNFAGFHKYFKQITGKSPLIYQKEFFHIQQKAG